MRHDDTYDLFKVKWPFSKDLEYMKENSAPLKSEDKEEIHLGLRWSDFKWGTRTFTVKGEKVGELNNFMYLSKKE